MSADANAAAVLGRSMGFPPRVGADGRVAWSSGEDNVRESIRIVLSTDRGERLRRPTFGAGLGRLLFEPNTAATRHAIQERIARAIAAWEPRVEVTSIDVAADADDPQAVLATIAYRLVATQAPGRLTLSLALGS